MPVVAGEGWWFGVSAADSAAGSRAAGGSRFGVAAAAPAAGSRWDGGGRRPQCGAAALGGVPRGAAGAGGGRGTPGRGNSYCSTLFSDAPSVG